MNKPATAAWEQDEFWKEVVNVMTRGKKLRPDSYLCRLTADELQQLSAVLSSGLPFSEQVKLAPKFRGGSRDGEAPSDTTLSEISKAIRQVWVLRGLERQQMLNAATRERGQALGLDSKLVDTVLMVVGEEALAQHAQGMVGKFSLQAAAALLKRDKQLTDQERLKEQRKDEQTKALEFCLEEAKKFPDVQELFKAAFAALKKARSK